MRFALAHAGATIEAARAFLPADADLVYERFILDTELSKAVSELTDESGEAQNSILWDVKTTSVLILRSESGW